jgi:PAS domain-containing protein
MSTPPLFAPASSQQFFFQPTVDTGASGTANTTDTAANNYAVNHPYQQQQQQQQQQIYPELADLFTDYFLHEFDETGGLTAYNAMMVAAAAAQQQQQQQPQFLLPTGRGIMTPFHAFVSNNNNNNNNNNNMNSSNNHANTINAIINTPFVRPSLPAATAHKFAVAAAVAAAQQQQQQHPYVTPHHIAKKHKGGITLSSTVTTTSDNQQSKVVFGSQQQQPQPQQHAVMDSFSSFTSFLQQQQQHSKPNSTLYNISNTSSNPNTAMSSLSSRLGLTVTEQGQVVSSSNKTPNLTTVPSSAMATSGPSSSSTTTTNSNNVTNNFPFSMPFHRIINKEEQDPAVATVAAATIASLQPTKINLPVGHGIRLGSTSAIAAAALPVTAPPVIVEQQVQQLQQLQQNVLAVKTDDNVTQIQPSVLYDVSKLETGLATKEVEDRRLRNREHAKRSRVRKKFLLEALQHDVKDLQSENQRLRLFIQQHIPGQALQIIHDCCGPNHEFQIGTNNEVDESDMTPLAKTDTVLVQTLTRSQQNFILTDPTLPDNPIVFASHGFLELTGYTREEVSGREV